MRFMMIVRATKASESGVLPSADLISSMDKFNEGMMKAGVLVSGDGLYPSAKGARVKFEGGKPHVVSGPFAETRELIAGFWIIQTKSLDEAIAWASRCPGGDGKVDNMGGTFELELRQVYDASDFPAELQAAAPFEQQMRAKG